MKENKHKKLINGKKLLLCFIAGQVEPSMIQQMEALDEYKQLKQDQDLITTMNIVQSVYYANKDDG